MTLPTNLKSKYSITSKELISSTDYFKKLSTLQENDLQKPVYSWLDKGHKSVAIVTGQTNNGKSFFVTTDLGPHWLSNYGNLHILVAPHKSTLTPSEINVPYLRASYEKGIFCETMFASDDKSFSWVSVRKSLKQGVKVLLVISDKKLSEEFKNIDSVDIIKSICETQKVLVTRDEMSYGTVSDWINYKEATGYGNKLHKGVYINNLLQMWEWGCSLIGFTATPHKELTGDLKPKPGYVYEIISEFPDKENYKFHQGWVGEYAVLPPLDKNNWDDDVVVEYLQQTCEVARDRKNSINKLLRPFGLVDNENFLSMIMLETEPKKKPDPNKMHVGTLKRLIRQYNIIPEDNELMVVLETGWEIFNSKGELVDSGKGEIWQDIIKSPDTKVTTLASLYKLQYGVNFPNICHLTSFRCPTARNSDGPVIIQGIQILGRAVRSNLVGTGFSIVNALMNKGLYSTVNSYLGYKNTFNVFAIDYKQPFWNDTFETFLDEYASEWATQVSPILFKENKFLNGLRKAV